MINNVMNKQFSSEFDRYVRMIESGYPFCFMRLGDGEALLASGRAVKADSQAWQVDRWKSDGCGMSVLGADLNIVMQDINSSFHFGISCPCCDIKRSLEYQYALRNQPNLTYANLWANANYIRFKEFFNNMSKPYAIVVNESAILNNFPDGLIDACFVPDDCVMNWEKQRSVLAAEFRKFASSFNKTTVFVSAGPLAEAAIFIMWNANPSNQYIDVGSALDEWVYGKKTRPYMMEDNVYANRICSFSF